MWIVLLVVAPVVIAVATSVRRREAARQQFQVTLGGDGFVAGSIPKSFPIHSWLSIPDSALFGSEPDLTLYMSVHSSPEISDLLASKLRGDERQRAIQRLSLPPDAVLLGHVGRDGKQLFPNPTNDSSKPITVLWFSLAHGQVVDVQVFTMPPAGPR